MHLFSHCFYKGVTKSEMFDIEESLKTERKEVNVQKIVNLFGDKDGGKTNKSTLWPERAVNKPGAGIDRPSTSAVNNNPLLQPSFKTGNVQDNQPTNNNALAGISRRGHQFFTFICIDYTVLDCNW